MSEYLWHVEFDIQGEFYDCETCGYTYEYFTVETEDFETFRTTLRFGCTGVSTFSGRLDEVIEWVEQEGQIFELKQAESALRELQGKLKALN